MRIRFNTDLPACTFDNGKIVVKLKACDQNDLLAFSQGSKGFRIPAKAWVEKTVDGVKVKIVDYSMLTEEETKAMMFDDDVFIGTRLVEVSGVQDEEGKDLSLKDIPEKCLGDLITLLKREYPEFMVWCQEYILGSKKKSGGLEIIE
jgi:hypothetical protein